MTAKKFIDFIITQKCTYRCEYCSQTKKLQTEYNEATNETIDNFLLFLNTIDKDFEITISGGEALLHKSFFKLISEIKSKGFKINLISNLSFNSEKYENIIQTLQNSLNMFDFSMHLDEIDNFEETLIKLEKIINYIQNNNKITVHIPIYKLNTEKERKIAAIKEICNKYNINYDFQHIRILNSYIKYNEAEQKYFKNEKFEKSFAKICYAGFYSAIIYEDGSVYRCYSSRYNKLNYLGNINDKNFKLNNSPLVCTNKQCTCPKPKQYKQITDKTNYIQAMTMSIYNLIFLPSLIFKNRKRVLEKIRQKISYF